MKSSPWRETAGGLIVSSNHSFISTNRSGIIFFANKKDEKERHGLQISGLPLSLFRFAFFLIYFLLIHLKVSIYPTIHPESTWKKEIKKVRVLHSLRKTVQYSYPNSPIHFFIRNFYCLANNRQKVSRNKLNHALQIVFFRSQHRLLITVSCIPLLQQPR